MPIHLAGSQALFALLAFERTTACGPPLLGTWPFFPPVDPTLSHPSPAEGNMRTPRQIAQQILDTLEEQGYLRCVAGCLAACLLDGFGAGGPMPT